MTRQVYRASLFHLRDHPSRVPPGETFFADGALVVDGGHVVQAGPWDVIAPTLEADVPVAAFDNALIVPGFVDAHVHYPQLDVIASPAPHLLAWLEDHTFPSEVRFSDRAVAAEAAGFFLDQLLAHGTTTALVYPTVHANSVDLLFEAARDREMRIVSGKVLMDRLAPEGLLDTAEGGIADSAALIKTWHGAGRISYAITPRFAVTSTPRQLELAGELLRASPGVLMHTHLSENPREVEEVRKLFAGCGDYLGVYEKYGLATDHSVFAHCLHLTDGEWRRMAANGSSIAFCPTSNLFLGSGLFDLARAEREGVTVGLATDVGGGTSLSLLQTMNEAFKVGQLRERMTDPFTLFYLATLGGAKALKLDSKIGNFEPGKEADFLVLDLAASPLLRRRVAYAKSADEILFALAILGDDRAVRETYVMGKRAYARG